MKTILIILDGWGISDQQIGNAVLKANTPCFDFLATNYPYALLETSSEKVGLSWGVWGNSETGHSTIGSGRICWQYLEEINSAIENHEIENNIMYINYLKSLQAQNKALHVIFLCSDGNVHSNYKQVIAFVNIAQKYLKRIWLHLITDGRDTEPKIAKKFIGSLYSHQHSIDFSITKIATMIGRYYAMDRDDNWDNVAKAYNLIVNKKAKINIEQPRIAINESYKLGTDDENMVPILIDPNYQFNAGDGVFFGNFRADRIRQLVRAFGQRDLGGIFNQNLKSPILTLTDYLLPNVEFTAVYPIEILKNTMSEIISHQGLNQLHIAETEKYAHVTYFFGGGNEKPFNGQKNQIIPSHKVKSYDLDPKMSANEIGYVICDEVKRQKHQFILTNFANADMVGHTGNFQATISACEAVDKNLKNIYSLAIKNDYSIFITADHGNADLMLNPITYLPNKEHSTNPVPFIFVDKNHQKSEPGQINTFYTTPPIGILADIAPTILDHLEIQKPSEMTGESLLKSLS